MGYRGLLLGLYWGNGKENGNYYNGLYRDYRVYQQGKLNGPMNPKPLRFSLGARA